jgi:Protein of unknown function (DUF2723)
MARNKSIFAVLALVFACLSAPMLATSPQNPDGAELVMTAVQGGVLHPPGYPLQSWLDRAVMKIGEWPALAVFWDFLLKKGLDPHTSLVLNPIPTWLLSFQSLICFSVGLFFLALVLSELGASVGGCCVGVLFFALYPPAWQLAVQPEKYALFFLLLAIFSFFSLREQPDPPVFLASLFFGLMIAQHVVGFVALPLVLVCFLQVPKSNRAAALALGVGVALVVSGGLYVSMLSLTCLGAWPDWGKLQSIGDVFGHFTRRDLGFFSVDPNQRPGTRAIEVALRDLWSTFSMMLILLPLGFLSMGKRIRDLRIVLWGCVLAAALVFVFEARSGGYPEVAVTWLERYTAVPVFFLAGVVALGWDEVMKRIPRRLAPVGLCLAVMLFLVFFWRGRSLVDASKDATLDLYSRALGESLPASAIYIGGCNDLEYFYGAKTGDRRRFPICGEYKWYRDRVLPRLEPRLEPATPFHPGYFEVETAQKALKEGFAVYSTDLALLEGVTSKPVRRGVLWAVGSGDIHQSPRESLAASISLCSLLERTTFDPPTRGHYYSQFLWQQIALAFMDTSDELRLEHENIPHAEVAVERTSAIAFAALNGSSSDVLKKVCRELTGVQD